MTRIATKLSLSVALAVLSLGTAAVGAAGSRDSLFVIERSKNANVVVYDALVTPSGALNFERPVDAYWIVHAEEGQREELSGFERRRAYGFDIDRSGGSKATMRLVAVGDRTLDVTRVGNDYRAETTINGRPAVLQRVFVQTDEGGLIPDVEFIDLHGVDRETGEALRERLDDG